MFLGWVPLVQLFPGQLPEPELALKWLGLCTSKDVVMMYDSVLAVS